MMSFDLPKFAEREQRRVERLTRAAYGVGAEHAWFRILDRSEQVAKVQEWVDNALYARECRLNGLPYTIRDSEDADENVFVLSRKKEPGISDDYGDDE